MFLAYFIKHVLVFFIFFSLTTGALPLKKNDTLFKYKKNPQFSFELPQFKNWTLSSRSETIMGYLPDDALNLKFEYPPNVAVLLVVDLSKLHKPKGEKHGTNSHGVIYQKYFVKGFSKNAIKFEKNEKVVFILSVEDLPQHGLHGELVEDTIIRTFKFY